MLVGLQLWSNFVFFIFCRNSALFTIAHNEPFVFIHRCYKESASLGQTQKLLGILQGFVKQTREPCKFAFILPNPISPLVHFIQPVPRISFIERIPNNSSNRMIPTLSNVFSFVISNRHWPTAGQTMAFPVERAVNPRCLTCVPIPYGPGYSLLYVNYLTHRPRVTKSCDKPTEWCERISIPMENWAKRAARNACPWRSNTTKMVCHRDTRDIFMNNECVAIRGSWWLIISFFLVASNDRVFRHVWPRLQLQALCAAIDRSMHTFMARWTAALWSDQSDTESV